MLKKITKEIVNESDKKACSVKIERIIPQDKTIICTLFDSEGKVVARNRVYAYDGPYKHIPIDDLPADEIEYMAGGIPSEAWEIATVKMWLDDRQTVDDDGAVLKDDLYAYPEKATKEDLLELASTDKKAAGVVLASIKSIAGAD